jgi:hypothetical protein
VFICVHLWLSPLVCGPSPCVYPWLKASSSCNYLQSKRLQAEIFFQLSSPLRRWMSEGSIYNQPMKIKNENQQLELSIQNQTCRPVRRSPLVPRPSAPATRHPSLPAGGFPKCANSLTALPTGHHANWLNTFPVPSLRPSRLCGLTFASSALFRGNPCSSVSIRGFCLRHCKLMQAWASVGKRRQA